ncbi:MAG: hypothetical protein UY74_C0065G0004 [Candidatus Kaiserbacteria bacterium GW2011_GWC2_52_8b]|uniref:Baseplate protein J-like domain-containing protein n=1 Tax=Candidatus Kaiserbacteria bacterium GW2011_GWC2_52_8b TaxID=1618676 RepID=A0A0G1XFM0_9BACT|nr:MAG: hypothetical protein UY74_C0065G0004 [Candidatus Kaiserbacteria bacterium GW2011_GWC2_52_8b]
MAKDYFQDIVPPQGARPRRESERRLPNKTEEPLEEHGFATEAYGEEQNPPERSIRNIPTPLRRRPREEKREVPGMPPPIAPHSSRLWMWIAVAVSIFILIVLALFVFRSTTVTVIPRSHPVVFDQSAQFTAYPAANATAEVLTYTVEVSDLQDSEVVQSSGTEHAETKASGSIIIENNYSASPVKLIKNTRFENPSGLIFRIPADVVVPGKSAGKPGAMSVTVVADKSGDQYNIGPTDTFTVPGLKSNAAMYSGVRAHSDSAMTGGFVGDRPAVESGAMQAAQATIRTRIAQKIRDSISAREGVVVIPDLIKITFTEGQNTSEAGGGVRVHEKAHVEMPVFPKDAYAKAVANVVSADAENSSIEIVPSEGYAANTPKDTTVALGKAPLTFTLTGKATIVWHVDAAALHDIPQYSGSTRAH